MYVFIYPQNEQDVAQGQFLTGVQLVWIQSILSPKLVALLRQKTVWPIIYP